MLPRISDFWGWKWSPKMSWLSFFADCRILKLKLPDIDLKFKKFLWNWMVFKNWALEESGHVQPHCCAVQAKKKKSLPNRTWTFWIFFKERLNNWIKNLMKTQAHACGIWMQFFVIFFAKNRKYDFQKGNILTLNLVVIWKVSTNTENKGFRSTF